MRFLAKCLSKRLGRLEHIKFFSKVEMIKMELSKDKENRLTNVRILLN